MDNGYFIGYRIDVKNTDLDIWEHDDLFIEFHIDNLPGEEWMVWSNPEGGSSLLWMNMSKSDYRCPIDREELWRDLHHRTFDFPFDGMAVFQELWESDLYKRLIKDYGSKDVNVRWGIFLCLG